MSPLKRFFPLTSRFFGLTLSYKKHLLDEIYFCIKHLNLSYGDVMKMPTYQRRYFILTLHNEHTDAQEARENKSNPTSTGNGRRTSTVSGDTLKRMINDGEIK